MLSIISARDRDRLVALYRGGWDPPAQVVERVREILADVRARGDHALLDYSRRFDDPGFELERLRVPLEPPEDARALVPQEIAAGLDLARRRVARFHERQLHEDVVYTEQDGTGYGFYARPLDSVAAYVPGGTAILPSSVVMSVVPAKIAGVARVIVLSPPQRDGEVAPAVRYACSLCGVDELYAVGGAQAIAAAAYGTPSIARVDKIVGPGNVWVTEAKRQVFGTCGIDGLAGPSDVLVVADESASAELVTGELLAQAEHDPLARVAAVSQSRALLERCASQLGAIDTAGMERGEIVASVLKNGCFLVHAQSREAVFEVVEGFAPEHLSLQVADPDAYLPHVRKAGAVFVGEQTPVACGDYLAGTNHVLPTSGAARFSSGLRTADFQRTFALVRNSAQRMQSDAPLLAALAQFEGLPQHARTARMRLA